MRVDYELIVRDVVSADKIAYALAIAYDIAIDSVEVQEINEHLPIRKTTKLWCRHDSVPGEFSTYLLIYLCGVTSELDFLAVAAKISHAIGCDCLVPDDDSPVASSMFLIKGLASPEKVELIEEQNDDAEDTVYTLKGP